MAALPGLLPCWLKNLKDSFTILRYFNNPPANPPDEEIRVSFDLRLLIQSPIPAASDEYVEMSFNVSNKPTLESSLL